MKRFLLFCMALAAFCWQGRAAELPTVSTEGNEVWYLVQFMSGQNVLTAQGDGEQVLTGVPTAKASQLWKVEGSASAGYTLTSKSGLKLYTNTTAADGKFYAGSAPTSNTLFSIQTTTNSTYSGSFVISPKANSSVYMNQWGGAGTGKELGLWTDRADANQPLQFVSEEDFNATSKPLPLIPYPAQLTRGEGEYNVAALTTITYVDDSTKVLAEKMAAQVKVVTGATLTVEAAGASAKANAINMALDATKAAEGYSLTIDANGVVIAAAKYAGFFYGFQTLKQLLPAAIYADAKVDAAAWTLPYVEIEDEPILGHRGFHFDVARHFFTTDEVKKLLDMASVYKLNRFHWHLTDDQGWRVEIPEYPKLTTVGAVRKASFTLEASPKFYDDTKYGEGCFYTLDELRDIVAYAKERNIEIIPEIDLPGHMVAAIAAYPELSCDSTKTYEVRVDGGISHDVLNVGDDKVIDFLKCVLGHVAEVFPYELLHIGGDECPTGAWVGNPDCDRRIKEEGLTGVEELQPWLVEELGTWLDSIHGKRIVVWDELLKHWSNKFTIKPVVMAWNGTGYTVEAYNHGLQSISVPYYPLYFDFMQVDGNQELVDEPYIGGWGVNPLPNVYNFNPLGNMSGKESFLLGTQANLWTETCSSIEEAEYQYYPRLLALSEIAWLPAAKKNWVNFYQRLQQGVKVLDANDVFYAKHYIEQPELTAEEAAVKEAEELLADSKPGMVGYPAQADYDKLSAALAAGDAEALTAAIAAYKTAPLVQPQAGKYYQIFSASTATRTRYNGSSVYVKNSQLKMHYTPQAEPEELWVFEAQADGSYLIKQATSGRAIAMPTYNKELELAETGTPVVLASPEANSSYSYIPGVVTISAAADKTGDIRRFFGNNSGILTAYNNASLCFGGTWRNVEVTNYSRFLKSLCDKCEDIIATAKVGEYGEPSQEAVDFLNNSVLTPGRAALGGTVTEEQYIEFANLYQQFLDMPRASILDGINSAYYYRIRNAYPDFSSNVAGLNTSTMQVQPMSASSNDNCLWVIQKNDDGTVSFYNKAMPNAGMAYVDGSSIDQVVKVGQNYTWTLKEVGTDTNNSGIAILDKSGSYSWYTNPGAFPNILLKPYDWGASIWTFERMDIEVPTGIDGVTTDGKAVKYYDLSGRRVQQPTSGIYVTDQNTKVLK